MLVAGAATLITAAYAGAVAGAAVLAGAIAAAAFAGYHWGRDLSRLARAIRQAGAGEEVDTSRVSQVRELRRLDEALVALRLRIQVADEVAERHRREAESAGTGMFELLSGLVAAEEGTRGQLAAELHDTVAQSLGAARQLLSDSAIADPLPQVMPLVEEAEEALRATMARTRPAALRGGDLAAAVSQFRDDLELRYGLRVSLEWPVMAYPLPLATAVTIYRFFQEALLNVVKHADVDEAVASLTVDSRYVTAVVRDNGPGFDLSRQPAAGSGGRHVGLGLLRERARLAGGSLDVMSAPGAGTMLSLRLPRPSAPADWAAHLPSLYPGA
jgi:signal transduction histidine kinase